MSQLRRFFFSVILHSTRVCTFRSIHDSVSLHFLHACARRADYCSVLSRSYATSLCDPLSTGGVAEVRRFPFPVGYSFRCLRVVASFSFFGQRTDPAPLSLLMTFAVYRESRTVQRFSLVLLSVVLLSVALIQPRTGVALTQPRTVPEKFEAEVARYLYLGTRGTDVHRRVHNSVGRVLQQD